jgi:phage terminase small subunit
MEAKKWKSLIVKNCKAVGTYQKAFEPVIATLADILEKRDEAQEFYVTAGKQIIVEHTNKGGSTNLEQNPVVRLINDLNRDALQYWRELGLTPSGLRKINEESLKQDKRSALDKVLESLES